MKSPAHKAQLGLGQVEGFLHKESLSFYAEDSSDQPMELKAKTLRSRFIRRVAQILAIVVTILLSAKGYGSPLSEALYDQPAASLNTKIVMVTNFYRTFHVYKCLVDVRIEENITFAIELREPNAYELKQIRDFLGDDFSNLKRHGFSRLSILIGKTRYVWEVK